MWHSACLTYTRPQVLSPTQRKQKIANGRDDWLKKCEPSQKKRHLRKALKSNSLMKWLMVKYMDLQLRMETFLGTQSNMRKLGVGTTKTERCLHMFYTQIRGMARAAFGRFSGSR